MGIGIRSVATLGVAIGNRIHWRLAQLMPEAFDGRLNFAKLRFHSFFFAFKRVYHRHRLKIINPCISVSGTIVDATRGKQKDG